jgi:hypothetical protein
MSSELDRLYDERDQLTERLRVVQACIVALSPGWVRPRNTMMFDARGNIRDGAGLLVWGGVVWMLYWFLGLLNL